MNAFLTALMTLFGSMFGQDNSQNVQDIAHPTPIVQQETQTPAPKSTQKKAKPEQKVIANDGTFDYESGDTPDGWSVVRGGKTHSERAQKGENGQVSTIWGNGTQGQGTLTMDHPRDLQVDGKGDIYFVDGSQNTAKLRMFDGKENKTIVDLVNNPLINNTDGYFISTGTALINNTLYIASTHNLYRVEGNRITEADLKIPQYMKDNHLYSIYRIEKHQDWIYIMFVTKSYYYSIVKYNPNTRQIELVLPENTYPAPYNMYVYGNNDIFISTEHRYIVWEQLNPRQTKVGVNTGDPDDMINDVWIGQDGDMYYSVTEDKMYCKIYKNPKGNGLDDLELVAGGRRGFIDGIKDEVEMDKPIDFEWDGSGYVFADMNNNAIRKLWLDVPPAGQ